MKISKELLFGIGFVAILGIVGTVEQPNKSIKINNEILLNQLKGHDKTYISYSNKTINKNEPVVYWLEGTKETVITYPNGEITIIKNK